MKRLLTILAVVVLSVAVLLGLGMLVYLDLQRPTFELKKDEWTCTKSRVETVYSYSMKAGDVWIPQYRQEVVCLQWTRK